MPLPVGHMLKRLSNYSEQRLHDEIIGATNDYHGHIYRKVRVADVVDISKLASRDFGSYALQAHFDFCICDDDHQPAFAIEYDGGGHGSKNDRKKDAIAQQADLALFRIDERLLNRTRGGLTFLQYLVHTYFLGQSFLEMQEQGQLDPSEPFMMSGFLKADAKHIFDSDFDFSGPARGRLTKIMRRAAAPGGPLYHLNIAGVMYGKADSSFVGFASVPVGNQFVYGRAQLDIGTPCLGKLGELPFGWSALGDYCEGMMLESLCDELETLFSDGGHTIRTRTDIEQEIARLGDASYKPLRGFGGKDDWLMSYAFPRKGD